jgi:hypothetical protein
MPIYLTESRGEGKLAVPTAMLALTQGRQWAIATTGGFIFSGKLIEISSVTAVLQGASIRKLNFETDTRGPTITIAVDQIVAFWED